MRLFDICPVKPCSCQSLLRLLQHVHVRLSFRKIFSEAFFLKRL